MKRAVNLLFSTIGLFILTWLIIFADLGNYKAFSLCFIALIIDMYVIYKLNTDG